MNWNQTGMPAALVSRIGRKREVAEFKSVLNDARNHVMRPVDVESMAEELVKSGGREFVEMVRELTMALENARTELENANRRYERLRADLEGRGVDAPDDSQALEVGRTAEDVAGASPDDGLAEWEEWDRRFRSLLG